MFSYGKVPPELMRDRKRGGVEGMEGKLISSEVNTRAVSRGQNKLICKFKMVPGGVISIME